VDAAKHNIRKKRKIASYRGVYGKEVSKYNRQRTNRINSHNYIAVDDLLELSDYLERLQEYYSRVLGGYVKEAVVRGSSMFDQLYQGKISLRDTVLFAILEAYNKKVLDGEFATLSVGDMRTLNQAVRDNPVYQEFEAMFGEDERKQEERTKQMIENKDIRNQKKQWAKSDNMLRNIFYGIRV
jgi:hypothetical protein